MVWPFKAGAVDDGALKIARQASDEHLAERVTHHQVRVSEGSSTVRARSGVLRVPLSLTKVGNLRARPKTWAERTVAHEVVDNGFPRLPAGHELKTVG